MTETASPRTRRLAGPGHWLPEGSVLPAWQLGCRQRKTWEQLTNAQRIVANECDAPTMSAALHLALSS